MKYPKKSVKKTCLAALLNIAGADSATMVKTITKAQNEDEVKKALGKLTYDLGKANIIDKDSNTQVFIAGWRAARKLKEIQEKIDQAAEKMMIEDCCLNRTVGLNGTLEEVDKKLMGGRPTHLDMRIPGNGSNLDRYMRIRNKPPQNITRNPYFNPININRGGYQSKELLIDTDEGNVTKIIKQIYKHRKWIVLSVICGSIIYVLFRNRKLVRRFINRIKKFVKPFYNCYKKVSNHWIISNRFTQSLLVFHRVINRTSHI